MIHVQWWRKGRSMLLMDIVRVNPEPTANEGDIYALITCCEAGATRLIE